jgi:hypothetical protein
MPYKANTDFANLFPDGEEVTKAMRELAQGLTQCPNGHPLPHRTVWGRCNPLMCTDNGEPGTFPTSGVYGNREKVVAATPFKDEIDAYPRGMEEEAIEATVQRGDVGQSEKVQAQMQEAGVIMRATGINAARSAVMYVPPVPRADPVSLGGEKAWAEKRLDALLPLAFSQFEYDLQFGSNEVKRSTAKLIAGMKGFHDKGEVTSNQHQPVVIVQMGGRTPYDQQATIVAEGKADHVRQNAGQLSEGSNPYETQAGEDGGADEGE